MRSLSTAGDWHTEQGCAADPNLSPAGDRLQFSILGKVNKSLTSLAICNVANYRQPQKFLADIIRAHCLNYLICIFFALCKKNLA